MSAGRRFTGLLVAGLLSLPAMGRADTPKDTQTPHRAHKVKKPPPPPAPLPSGTQGPVPQVPLDAIAPVAPQVTYEAGLLTIVAPNSTLADILRSVRKHTAAEIEIPANANERVVTRLGPGPAREVVAELLNGSRFNYILLGSPEDPKQLVRVVLVAKTGPDTPNSPAATASNVPPAPESAGANGSEPEATDDAADDTPEQGTADAEQPAAATPDQPEPKSPQQILQELQQRQLEIQQRQQQQAQPQPLPGGRPGGPATQPQDQPQQQ